jgi:hypothetical protein
MPKIDSDGREGDESLCLRSSKCLPSNDLPPTWNKFTSLDQQVEKCVYEYAMPSHNGEPPAYHGQIDDVFSGTLSSLNLSGNMSNSIFAHMVTLPKP